MSRLPALALAAALLAAPAVAGNKLIEAGAPVAVAKSGLTVTPPGEWNRLAARPGHNAETWTLDGDQLNALSFYGGIADGGTLFRDAHKDQPLPRVRATMLVTDVPALLESSYRVALGTSLFTIDSVEPAPLAGRRGIRFTYSFTRQDENLPRRGEGRAAIIDGKLYLITFEAPRTHFFEAGVNAFRGVTDSAHL